MTLKYNSLTNSNLQSLMLLHNFLSITKQNTFNQMMNKKPLISVTVHKDNINQNGKRGYRYVYYYIRPTACNL